VEISILEAFRKMSKSKYWPRRVCKSVRQLPAWNKLAVICQTFMKFGCSKFLENLARIFKSHQNLTIMRPT